MRLFSLVLLGLVFTLVSTRPLGAFLQGPVFNRVVSDIAAAFFNDKDEGDDHGKEYCLSAYNKEKLLSMIQSSERTMRTLIFAFARMTAKAGMNVENQSDESAD